MDEKKIIKVECQIGTISNLLDFGLSTEQSRCPASSSDNSLIIEQLYETVSTDASCNYASLSRSDTPLQKIKEEFQPCKGRKSCEFEVDEEEMFVPRCQEEINRRREALSAQEQLNAEESSVATLDLEVYILAQCLELGLNNPFTGEVSNLTRTELGIIVTIIDIICKILFILAFIF